MKLKQLASDMLVAAGYDREARILEVIFKTGGKYRYKKVPPDEYDGLMSAESIGQYMHKHIIGRYPYERVS
jgi:KTSC domain